ncbi:hypothetical protein VTO73DRAFT_14639 [Trametes versicolor]
MAVARTYTLVSSCRVLVPLDRCWCGFLEQSDWLCQFPRLVRGCCACRFYPDVTWPRRLSQYLFVALLVHLSIVTNALVL